MSRLLALAGRATRVHRESLGLTRTEVEALCGVPIEDLKAFELGEPVSVSVVDLLRLIACLEGLAPAIESALSVVRIPPPAGSE